MKTFKGNVSSIKCKHTSVSFLVLTLLPLCAGVGNALEGGRGRAGTKLFQDFQMLSRIWTHPWCLQLDYISKENRVGLRRTRQNHTKHQLQNWEYKQISHTHTRGNGDTVMTALMHSGRTTHTHTHSLLV